MDYGDNDGKYVGCGKNNWKCMLKYGMIIYKSLICRCVRSHFDGYHRYNSIVSSPPEVGIWGFYGPIVKPILFVHRSQVFNTWCVQEDILVIFSSHNGSFVPTIRAWGRCS